MKSILVDNLEDGMEVARNIYGESDQVLLVKGSSIKNNYIDKLKFAGVERVYVVDDNSTGINLDKTCPISNETYLEAIKIIKDLIRAVKNDGNVNFSNIIKAVDDIIDDLLKQKYVLIFANTLKAYDGYTFRHSINVTIFTILIVSHFSYDHSKIRDIALGAFLHDIGKTKIDKDLLMKPGKLSFDEYNEVKKHSTHGYQIVEQIKEISKEAVNIIYQHHEYIDGTGYPRGLKGHQIIDGAQIVTIADIYDALTSDRVYKSKVMPNKALSIINDLKDTQLNSRYIDALAKHIVIYPIGTIVQLNNNQLAKVVNINKDDLNSPIVRLIEEEDGTSVKHLKEIDLLHTKQIKIDRIINS